MLFSKRAPRAATDARPRQSRQSRQSDPWGNRYIQSWRTELGGWFSLPGTSAATP